MPKTSMREMLYEHNTLNGLWFALVEFVLVMVASLALSAFELAYGRPAWSLGYFGIAVNSGAFVMTAIGQIRRHEPSHRFFDTYFGPGRQRVRRDYPNVASHTVTIVVALMFPFALAVLTLADV